VAVIFVSHFTKTIARSTVQLYRTVLKLSD